MSANQTGHVSLKDKIVSHLPGHKNQDKNMNGVPDRLEGSSHTGATDLNRNGIPDNLERGHGLVGQGGLIPGQTVNTTTTTTTTDPSGRPIGGNILRDEVVTQQTTFTEPALLQTTGQTGYTDLNRNGIPDQLERQGSYGQQTGYTDLNRNGIPDQLERPLNLQGGVVDVREAPVIVEQIQKPTVVHEVIKTQEVVEIQPVIEREREKLDVYEVVQPMREREVVATEVRTAVLPAQTRAAVVEDQSAFLAQRSAPGEFSTREVAPTIHQTVQNAAIVHETIIHKVIEEVQPVLYKEIDRPVLIKETLPIYEKIVEAPHAHHQTLPMRDMGVRTVTSTTTTGYTDLNRDGIPDQLQGGVAYQTTGLQSGIGSQGTFATGQTGYTDLNRNGIPDQLERQGAYGQSGLATDLNRNGIPDQLERQFVGGQFVGQQGGLGGGLPANTLLSQPQIINSQPGLMGQQSTMGQQGHRTLSDLNGNGVPDRMEKAHGLKDLNGNGVDDSLERRMGNTSLNSQRL